MLLVLKATLEYTMARLTTVRETKFILISYMQAYFVTIATILGTGILGLPVMLTQSGLYPFLISFLLDAIMQSVLIHFFTDLLQKAYAMQLHDPEEEAVPLSKMVEEEINLDSEDSGDIVMKEIHIPKSHGVTIHCPNLHSMGKLFLPCGIQQMFDVLIILQFVALLICYALAGSEAYAQLIGTDNFYVIPVFVWGLTFATIFAEGLIQPVISVLTFLKGSVLLATTFATFYVGMSVARHISNDFLHVGAPFLMGTVALGGAINTMPFTYEKIQYKKNQIANYRLAVHLGLWTCVILNILCWVLASIAISLSSAGYQYIVRTVPAAAFQLNDFLNGCWSVLDIVPQTVVQACTEGLQRQPLALFSTNVSSTANGAVVAETQCYGRLSLESAKFNGEISTLPLTKLLTQDYPMYTWVAVMVEVFIVVSITVSYLTVGSALHHTLTGVVHTVAEARGLDLDARSSRCCSKQRLITSCTSILAFCVIFSVAMFDPQGFVDILEKFASLTLNTQAGVFVFLMLLSARKHRSLHIPLPLPDWACHFLWTIPVFFGSAVLMDIYSTIKEIMNPEHLVPVLLNASNFHQNFGTASPMHADGALNSTAA